MSQIVISNHYSITTNLKCIAILYIFIKQMFDKLKYMCYNKRVVGERTMNYILVGMLIDLCERGKVTADFFAEKYEISRRTVYRYIETLECSGVMIDRLRGKNGGFMLKSEFSFFSMFLSKDEKAELKRLLDKNVNNKTQTISRKLNLDF